MTNEKEHCFSSGDNTHVSSASRINHHYDQSLPETIAATTMEEKQSESAPAHETARPAPAAASPNNKPPWQALGRFARHVGNGVQTHVRRWKREHDRRKLESHLTIIRQARLETEARSRASCTSPTSKLGELGQTLFSPLDGHFEMVNSPATPRSSLQESPKPVLDTDAVTLGESSFDEDTEMLVLDDGTEEDSPRILSMDEMRQLRQAMPTSIQLKIWKRLYSVARDGDAFKSFTMSVAGHRQTLLVIHTTCGQVFGGFADAHWGKLALRTDGSYYGTGRSFLFTILNGEVVIYPWQGVNEYAILCSTKNGGRLAMGGGGDDGSFGFCVQDHFTKGSSGPCATFGNLGPLCSTGDGGGSPHFDVVNFEAYGFVNTW